MKANAAVALLFLLAVAAGATASSPSSGWTFRPAFDAAPDVDVPVGVTLRFASHYGEANRSMGLELPPHVVVAPPRNQTVNLRAQETAVLHWIVTPTRAGEWRLGFTLGDPDRQPFGGWCCLVAQSRAEGSAWQDPRAAPAETSAVAALLGVAAVAAAALAAQRR